MSPPSVGRVSVDGIALRRPAVADGALIWRLAKRCALLDLNSPYAYLLWCRDFSSTSTVAHAGSKLLGFVTGYLRPGNPATLMIWQVGVCESVRRKGIAANMIDELVKGIPGVRAVEVTMTDENLASRRLFMALAEHWQAPVQDETLFAASVFPLPHQAERLYRIGPISRNDRWG